MLDLSSEAAMAQNTNGSKGGTILCCRRRTLTTRILPAIIQAFVVVAAWEVFKSVVPLSNEASVGNNARSVDQTKCPDSEISKAITLSILDLNSILTVSELPTRDRTLTYHLKTSVYVRPEKQSPFTLYPFGTLVTIGNLKLKPTDDNKVKNISVDIDVKDDSPKNVKNTVVEKVTSPPKVTHDTFDYAPELGKLQVGNKGGIEKPGNALDTAVRFLPGVAKPQHNNYLGVKGGINFDAPQNKQELMIREIFNRKNQIEANKKFDVTKVNIIKPPSDPYHYLNMLNQNLVKGFAYDSEPQDTNIPGFQSQINTEPLLTLDYSTQLQSHGVLIDENGEHMYAEGFLDRVSKLSSELFGTPVANATRIDTQINLSINSPNICQDLKDIDVLFLINSIHENTEQRQLARDTFLNPVHFPDLKIAHIFLIGKAKTSNLQQMLNQEQAAYQDIVQGDFFDTPLSATFKGLMGLRWVSHFCHHAKYIMKINEGVFVDTYKLVLGLIPAVKVFSGKRVMMCDFQPESSLTREGPNAVSKELFPGRSRLRPFCKGYAVLLSNAVIHSLVAASDYVRPIYLDNLYLYGILPFVSGNIEVYDLGAKRAFNNFGIETVNCYKTLLDECPHVAVIAFNERFTYLWNYVAARGQKPHESWENEHPLWNIPNYRRRI
uniref:Hexosyltransferase n=1 Tax=Arion vulgaris TaxID=1028688 RepID=A0A0B7B4H4_9EUPU